MFKSCTVIRCQGPRSIGQMADTAEIVTSAVVVDVSPARDNVYAVTLQVSAVNIKTIAWRLFLDGRFL